MQGSGAEQETGVGQGSDESHRAGSLRRFL